MRAGAKGLDGVDTDDDAARRLVYYAMLGVKDNDFVVDVDRFEALPLPQLLFDKLS